MPCRFGEKEQALILKLVQYFTREKEAGNPLLPLNAVHNRVADALEISLSTIQKLVTKGIETDQDHRVKIHAGHVSARGTPLYRVHQHIIRTRVYAMYEAREHITVRTLQKNLFDIDGIQISLGSLSISLKKLKFKWRKCTIANRKYLMEQPSIAQKRLVFLREYIKNKNSPYSLKPVVLDETWIFSKGAFRKSWQDDSLKTVRKKTGEGIRYIILHAGCEDGFIENASLIFKSGCKSGDYHDSMNAENFERWFTEQLLPNLAEPSLIIMDNAPYHCGLVEKIPNHSWTKQSLVEWLQKNNIPYPELLMKDQIWNIVKRHLPEKRYRMDELALKNGHRVLRLPPYHCQFNGIEMVWSECKRYYDAKIAAINPVTQDAVVGVWKEALAQVTPEKWKNYVRHTDYLISEAWEKEKSMDASNILPVIIDLNESESDESDSSDDN